MWLCVDGWLCDRVAVPPCVCVTVWLCVTDASAWFRHSKCADSQSPRRGQARVLGNMSNNISSRLLQLESSLVFGPGSTAGSESSHLFNVSRSSDNSVAQGFHALRVPPGSRYADGGSSRSGAAAAAGASAALANGGSSGASALTTSQPQSTAQSTDSLLASFHALAAVHRGGDGGDDAAYSVGADSWDGHDVNGHEIIGGGGVPMVGRGGGIMSYRDRGGSVDSDGSVRESFTLPGDVTWSRASSVVSSIASRDVMSKRWARGGGGGAVAAGGGDGGGVTSGDKPPLVRRSGSGNTLTLAGRSAVGRYGTPPL